MEHPKETNNSKNTSKGQLGDFLVHRHNWYTLWSSLSSQRIGAHCTNFTNPDFSNNPQKSETGDGTSLITPKPRCLWLLAHTALDRGLVSGRSVHVSRVGPANTLRHIFKSCLTFVVLWYSIQWNTAEPIIKRVSLLQSARHSPWA
jgi:hypothetical protein